MAWHVDTDDENNNNKMESKFIMMWVLDQK
jgi:hypothetical protein